jgi:hypothetical protein
MEIVTYSHCLGNWCCVWILQCSLVPLRQCSIVINSSSTLRYLRNWQHDIARPLVAHGGDGSPDTDGSCKYVYWISSRGQPTRGGPPERRFAWMLYKAASNRKYMRRGLSWRSTGTSGALLSARWWNNSQHSDQQNAQYCFLDIYIISHYIFLRASIHNGSSPGKPTKAIPRKAKLATFIYSWHGVKEPNS